MKTRVNQSGAAPRSMDAATLYAQTFAAPAFIVPDMLLAGHLTLVAGRPKSWKTWLVLQLAIAAASGRMFLERPIVTPGRVLFFELDDDPQQLHERLHLLVPQIGTDDHQALKNINFAHSLKPLRQGGPYHRLAVSCTLIFETLSGRIYAIMLVGAYRRTWPCGQGIP